MSPSCSSSRAGRCCCSTTLARKPTERFPEIAAHGLLGHPWVEIYRGDVRQPADWEKVLPEVRYVVHLAAETGTAQSMYEISRYTETNVGGTAALLNYLANRKHNIAKIILGSSRSVYGEGAYRCAQCGLVYPPMRAEDRLGSGQWEPAVSRLRRPD